MHICVGGYRDRALSKQCTIVYCVPESNPEKMILCLEVIKSSGENKLAQAKKYRNDYPFKALAKVVQKWAKLVGVNSSECRDLANLKSENDFITLEEEIQSCRVVNANIVQTTVERRLNGEPWYVVEEEIVEAQQRVQPVVNEDPWGMFNDDDFAENREYIAANIDDDNNDDLPF